MLVVKEISKRSKVINYMSKSPLESKSQLSKENLFILLLYVVFLHLLILLHISR